MCRRSKPLALKLLLDQGPSMKPKLDTGVEVYDNKVKKKQRYPTNKKLNMYLNIFNRGVEEVSHWHKYCCWIKFDETKS